jgi:hypothetical protein
MEEKTKIRSYGVKVSLYKIFNDLCSARVGNWDKAGLMGEFIRIGSNLVKEEIHKDFNKLCHLFEEMDYENEETPNDTLKPVEPLTVDKCLTLWQEHYFKTRQASLTREEIQDITEHLHGMSWAEYRLIANEDHGLSTTENLQPQFNYILKLLVGKGIIKTDEEFEVPLIQPYDKDEEAKPTKKRARMLRLGIKTTLLKMFNEICDPKIDIWLKANLMSNFINFGSNFCREGVEKKFKGRRDLNHEKSGGLWMPENIMNGECPGTLEWWQWSIKENRISPIINPPEYYRFVNTNFEHYRNHYMNLLGQEHIKQIEEDFNFIFGLLVESGTLPITEPHEVPIVQPFSESENIKEVEENGKSK